MAYENQKQYEPKAPDLNTPVQTFEPSQELPLSNFAKESFKGLLIIPIYACLIIITGGWALVIALFIAPVILFYVVSSLIVSLSHIFRSHKQHNQQRTVTIVVSILCGLILAMSIFFIVRAVVVHNSHISNCAQKAASGEYVPLSKVPDNANWRSTECSDLVEQY